MYDLIYLEELLKTTKDVNEDYQLLDVNISVDCLEIFDRVFRNVWIPQRCSSGLTNLGKGAASLNDNFLRRS
jgi:hypothetical protein